jgi:hypothetical protein
MGWIEWFGYAASVLVALSLTMHSIVKLRWFNLVGAGMFSAYGFLIAALPVAFLNGFIVRGNVYHLFGIYRRSEQFHLVDARLDDPLVKFWLSHHHQEIERHFPDLAAADPIQTSCCLVLRDSEPAGIMVGRQQGASFEVLLDYVFPPYRDFKTGHFLYAESGFFNARQVTRVTAHSSSPRHQSYLRRMGFKPVPGATNVFEYALPDTA